VRAQFARGRLPPYPSATRNALDPYGPPHAHAAAPEWRTLAAVSEGASEYAFGGDKHGEAVRRAGHPSGVVQNSYLFAGVDQPLRMTQWGFTCPTFNEACTTGTSQPVCVNHTSVNCTNTPTPNYYEVDLTGNVRRLRDSHGDDLGGYRYTAFGQTFPPDTATPAPPVTQLLRWKARPFLNVAGGLYDMRARFWNPQMGAFLNIDAYAYHDANSTLWGWGGQNPIKWNDPTGNCPACIGAAIGAGVGAVVGYYSYYFSTPSSNWSWGDAALATADGAAVGALAGGSGAALGILAGGGSLTAAFGGTELGGALGGFGALSSTVTNAGGKLDQVLDAIAQNFADLQPTSALEALKVIQQATSQVGLEPGIASLEADGTIVLNNVGGVMTVLSPDGTITVKRGSEILKQYCP
jgi:RHS repeat-associated protein